MPRRVQTLPTSDFRGGINYMADAFQLGPNEAADALNVDFDPNGGFARRRPIYSINTALSIQPKNIWTFTSSDGTFAQILAQQGNDAAYSTGANFTAINPDALTMTGTMFGATANDKCYIQRWGEQAAFTWTGAAAAVLTDAHGAYNDDIAAPTGGKMPKARYICRHRNFLFHAVINEAGTIRYNRLRFSHPFSDLTGTKGVEDYRTFDWIQLPGDGDLITGMASWGEQLVIFKQSSVWVLRGYDAESFQLENISMSVGAVSQKAIAVGDEGVYFFSWPNGLQLFDGSKVHDLWYPLTPVTAKGGLGTRIDQLSAQEQYHSNATVGYVQQRVWVNLTSTDSTAHTNDLTFVYDPRLGKGGGWTRYNTALDAMTVFHPPGVARKWYAVSNVSTGYVVEVEEPTQVEDKPASAEVGIDSNVYTRWFDLGDPALVKRWKHPIFVVDSNDDQVLTCDVFRDYDFTSSYRQFDITLTAPPPGNLWNASTWGGTVWASGTVTGTQRIEKGGLLGRGTAIALKINGPTAGNQAWAVNSITWKYIPRRIRS